MKDTIDSKMADNNQDARPSTPQSVQSMQSELGRKQG